MATTITGSGVDNIVDGTITNADINASAGIAGSKVDGSFGKVLQVVQTVLNTSTTYTNSGTATDIAGMTVTITPTSTSSKIYITCVLSFSTSNNGCGNGIRLARNGTWIARPSELGSTIDAWFCLNNNYGQANQDYNLNSCSAEFLDSPASTSALTYKLNHYGVVGTTPIKINLSNTGGFSGISTITAMEIGA